MQEKVLILGANGQLGSDLVRVFKSEGVPYVGFTPAEFNALTDNIDDQISPVAPKYIINCIAMTNVDGCEDDLDTAFKLNAYLVHKLAKYCALHDIVLIQLSTDYVFDGKSTDPYTEESVANPLSVYGLSKHTGDLSLKNYHDKYFILRVSSLFGIAGASGKGGNFITTMQRLAQTRDEVQVISDQITSPTSTFAVAKCISYLIKHKITAFGIYNCVSRNHCSWYEFAAEIFKLSNLDGTKLKKKLFTEYNFQAQRPQYGVLSTAKLDPFYMMPTWQESLAEYFTHAKS